VEIRQLFYLSAALTGISSEAAMLKGYEYKLKLTGAVRERLRKHPQGRSEAVGRKVIGRHRDT